MFFEILRNSSDFYGLLRDSIDFYEVLLKKLFCDFFIGEKMAKYTGVDSSVNRVERTFKDLIRQLNDFQYLYPEGFSEYIQDENTQRKIKLVSTYQK